MKLRLDEYLASEVFIYVDGGRIIAHLEMVCWQAAKRFCSICNSLGIQYVSRKRKELSLPPGPWVGTVGHTLEKELLIRVSKVKIKKESCPITGDIDEGG